jgi:hypothetical protein
MKELLAAQGLCSMQLVNLGGTASVIKKME